MHAARGLIEHAAAASLCQPAGLGLHERIELRMAADPPPERQEAAGAYWCTCPGRQHEAAEGPRERGADLEQPDD